MDLDRPDRSRRTSAEIAMVFDGDRLRQARQLALKTKQDLATALGVSPTAVGQYEANAFPPRPEIVDRLAKELGVLPEFFAAGRPQAKLESGDAFFRSLRATTARQRAKATSYTEQVWELVNAIERHVRLPQIDLPGFGVGANSENSPRDPVGAARVIRNRWDLGSEPVPHLVRLMENKGIVAVLVPIAEEEVRRIDAFSTIAFVRPLMILSTDKGDDVFRLRFSAAHELGHLVMHGEHTAGDPALEREANRFAAELLMPANVIKTELPGRFDFRKLAQLSERWGVSIKSLVYRSKELGFISDATARRAYIRLEIEKDHPAVAPRPVRSYPGEVPVMLSRAVELAETRGITVRTLADELAWKPARLERLLGMVDDRPALRLV